MAGMKSRVGKIVTLRRQGIGKSRCLGWLGISAAGMALVANLPLVAARRSGTPLRVLALVAITAVLRSRGFGLRADSRRAVIEAMELGAQLNDRFDGDLVESAALRARVVWFARSPHREVVRSYAKRLRRYERSRPGRCEPDPAIRHYRENVNRLSLALLWALATGTGLAAAEAEISRAADLRLLFRLVMLTQLTDDVVDVAQDRQRNLPSFASGPGVTAALLRAVVSSYAAVPWRLDGNFCLRLALGIVAGCARGMIAVRSVRGHC